MIDYNIETYRLDLGVVGTTFDNRQENISIIKDMERKEYVKYNLVRDRKNKFDKYAVRIVAVDKENKEYDLGFISKEDNKDIALALDKNYRCYIYDHIFIGGVDKKNHGMVVSIEYDLDFS